MDAGAISKIKLIIGLGNVGDTFSLTRHNVGFIFLDQIKTEEFKDEAKFFAEISKLEHASQKILLVKPTTMMNNSGKCVQSLVNFYKIQSDELLIVHDDLDIKFGEYKIQFAKGPKVHNGVNSVETHLNTQDFWRIRIGIENRTSDQKKVMTGEDYVLNRFSREEEGVLSEILNKCKNELFL